MFKSKTFNLFNEEKTRKRDDLYHQKRCRWMKYIVIPAMIGFILLLILMNVDFSGRRQVEMTTTKSFGTSLSGLKTETMPVAMDLETKQRSSSNNILPQTYVTMLHPVSCKKQGSDPCTIVCTNGNVKFLASDLEEFQEKCDDDMVVNLNNCSFPYQQLLTVNFRGYFNLKSLEISNCDLIEIVDGAFKIDSMMRLMTLKLSTTAFIMLTDKSFGGLIALKELNFTNVPSYSKFMGLKFLQPVAKTLQQVSFSQQSGSTVYDPFNWLNGTEKYSSLERVDLSGNNFANTLIRETFSNLLVVRELILRNCSITALPMDTFADIVDTLEYLDLSLNSLQMLNVSNLLGHKNGLRLELHGNGWSCTCENLELIRALKTDAFTYDNEPKCVSPPEWKDKPVKDVQLKCGDGEPPITIEPPVTPESTLTPKPTTSPTDDPVETPSPISSSTLSTTKTTTTSTKPDEVSTNPPEPTTVSTPGSVETPSTNTTTTATKSDEVSTPSIEPSLNTTRITLPPIKNTTLTPISTTEFDEHENSKESTTTALDTSKPTPPKPTLPPEPPKPTELTCKRLSTDSTNITISIRNFDARFIIQQTSSSSVALFIYNNTQHLSLFYFSTKSGTHEIGVPLNSHFQSSSTAYTIMHIDDLLSNETYIFCLMPQEEAKTSPFNCQSHFMASEISAESTAWLLSDDQAWFCTVIIFAMALTLGVGMISVYWLLRWRPTWLRGCKRIIRADNSISQQVYLLPKVERKSSNDSNYDNERNVFESRPNSTLNLDSHDYLQFYKNLQETNSKRRIHTFSTILAPNEEAPTIPKNQNPTTSMQCSISADKVRDEYDADDNENNYQSIDYYEHLF